MVKITQRSLIQLANMLCITLPPDFIKRFKLKKGDFLDLVVLNDAIIIIGRNINYDAKRIRADLGMLKELMDYEDDAGIRKWFDKLSPDEQVKITKKMEYIRADMKEDMMDILSGLSDSKTQKSIDFERMGPKLQVKTKKSKQEDPPE